MPKYPTNKPQGFPLEQKTVKHNRPIVFDSDLLFSEAYHSLNNPGKLMLAHFYMKRVMKQIGGKRSKQWIITNNGQIVFTYDDGLNRGITKTMFVRGLDSLINHGFIEIAKHGGGMLKSYSKYSIIDEWQSFGTDKFKIKKRPKDTRKLGWKSGGDNINSKQKLSIVSNT